jgi:hypothetical protein
MARTTAALLERALQIVDQVGAGQTATAEDVQFASDALLSLLAELLEREIVDVTFDPDDLNVEVIPDKLFNALADLLAADLQTAFAGGRISDAEREGLINRVRRVSAIGPSYDTLETEYF